MLTETDLTSFWAFVTLSVILYSWNIYMLMSRKAFFLVTLSMTTLMSWASEPDDTNIVVKSAAHPTIPLPTTGMSMLLVEQKFGTPHHKHASIGRPPITRWDYEKFSVYFEYTHVVHSLQRMNLPEKITVIVEKSQ